MLKNETIDFIKKVPPFNFLSPEEMESMVQDISLEYYPKGVKVLTQNGPPAEHLRLIKKGGVKVYMVSDEGEEITIDLRSEEEQFGIVSMISGDRSRANIVTVEDTICYLIPKQKVMDVLQRNPLINEFFVKSFFLNMIDRTYEETRKRCSLLGEGERVLFTTPVKDILRREPVVASEDISIREAAVMMAEEDISSLIIQDSSGVPVGIMTDRDLREKVVAKGRDVGEKVKLIISSPLIRVDADEFCFEALLRMIRYNIHHLIVVEGGLLKGVVTNHDFMVLQGSSPMVFVKEIDAAQGTDDLSTARPKMIKVVAELLREGARASNVTGLITELAEKFLNKVASIVERQVGPSPLPCSMFLYGNGGRREFTLNLQIRLGILYDESDNPDAVSLVESYFDEYVRVYCDTLELCGFADVSDNLDRRRVMSLSGWQRMFKEWADDPFENPIDEGYFDMRSIRGDSASVMALREQLGAMALGKEDCMDFLATQTVKNRPPIGFFKRFVVEKSGEHRNELDLYRKGIKPLVDVVRIFSLEKKINEMTTLKRVQVLSDRHGFEQARDISQALEYLFTLIIHDQISHAENNTPLDSFMNPERLSGLEKKSVKESFLLIASLYDIIEKGYKTERVEDTVS